MKSFPVPFTNSWNLTLHPKGSRASSASTGTVEGQVFVDVDIYRHCIEIFGFLSGCFCCLVCVFHKNKKPGNFFVLFVILDWIEKCRSPVYMKGKKFRCLNCGKMKHLRCKGQRFCNDRDCQNARKKKWKKDKYKNESDYRRNQQESTKNWLESKGGCAAYFRDYRKRLKEKKDSKVSSPEQHKKKETPQSKSPQNKTSPTQDNTKSEFSCQKKHRKRDAVPKITPLKSTTTIEEKTELKESVEPDQISANSDGSTCKNQIISGVYRIIPESANSDALLVNIQII